MDATASEADSPPDLHFSMTGEMFEFQTSAKSGDGVFRFRWTLDAGKTGPPEHVHDHERETFAVLSGTLRIWVNDVAHDLGPGERLTVPLGVRHRFLNPAASESVVVDVSLDGPNQEDVLVPLAYRFGGKKKMGLADLFVMIVHDCEVRGSRQAAPIARAAYRGFAFMLRLFGARPLPRAGAW